VDDAEVAGARRIAITASAGDGSSADGTMEIIDNDPAKSVSAQPPTLSTKKSGKL